MFRRSVLLSLAVLVLSSATAPTGAATLVYVNRCAGNCTFSPGPNDSVANTSPVFNQSRQLSAFSHSDALFDATVDCLVQGLARYDVQVVTSDPSPALHSELVVAGTPAQAGLPSEVWAVAPSNCAYVPNAPAFVFANVFPAESERLCWIGMQQLGFMAGLEHLFYCPDVMSTIEGCSGRAFQDRESACGINAPAPCQCGGSTRNSHAVMASVFGVGMSIFADGFESP